MRGVMQRAARVSQSHLTGSLHQVTYQVRYQVRYQRPTPAC